MPKARKSRPRRAELDEDTLNLRELALFLEDAPGFRLGLATYDVPETREATLQRLAAMVVDRPIHLTRLDLTRELDEERLLHRLQQHLRDNPTPDGKRPAVMVVGLEAAIDFHVVPNREVFRGGPILHNANLQRDAFPRLCPAPVVLWLRPLATTAFAQAAPDLWHWRSGTFTFAGAPEGRQELEHAIMSAPLIETGRLPRESKRERIDLLRDLHSELENTGDRDTSGNKARREAILFEIGLILYGLADPSEAIEYFGRSLDLYREIGDRRSEGAALGNLGLAYVTLGQSERAIDLYEQTLAIAREIDDRRDEGTALGSLGIAYAALGQVERAIDLYEHRLAIACEIGDRRGEGAALGNLGIAYKNLGQAERAIGMLEQASQIGQEAKDPRIIQVVSAQLEQLRSREGGSTTAGIRPEGEAGD